MRTKDPPYTARPPLKHLQAPKIQTLTQGFWSTYVRVEHLWYALTGSTKTI